jgi:hypothetical protein
MLAKSPPAHSLFTMLLIPNRRLISASPLLPGRPAAKSLPVSSRYIASLAMSAYSPYILSTLSGDDMNGVGPQPSL